MAVGRCPVNGHGFRQYPTPRLPSLTVTMDPSTDERTLRSVHEAELRKTATRRSWLCPGAGFALVGNGTWAITTFAVSLCVLPAAAWLAFRPATDSLLSTIAVFAIGIILWLVEQIAIQDGRYLVNGTAGPPVAAPGRYDVVVNVPASPESVTVPDDRYFVVQDAPSRSLDSRVLSWVHTDDILASRLWYLSPRGFFKPVE